MTIVLLIILFVMVAAFALYRHEIRSISRQLDKLVNLSTNCLLTQGLYYQELSSLVTAINRIIQKERQSRLDILKRDRQQQAFLTHVSHDIRTPLTSLKGYMQLIEQEDNPQKIDHYYSIIHQRINDLEQLLEQLFQYMKLKDADYPIELSPIPIQECLSRILFSYFDIIEKQGRTVTVDLTDQPLYVLGHDNLFYHIFDNILKNAVYHSDGFIQIKGYQEEEWVYLRFSNPIQEDWAEIDGDIFERFYKKDASRNYRSSGLGLSIAKAAVLKMNGQIEAHVNHQIFTVQIQFPLVQAPSQTD